MGAVLLASGAKGKRYSLNHSRIMIHQVSGGTRGTVADMRIAVQEADRNMDYLMKILSDATGKSEEQVRKDCDRDYYMSADEAMEYGVVDKVLRPGER